MAIALELNESVQRFKNGELALEVLVERVKQAAVSMEIHELESGARLIKALELPPQVEWLLLEPLLRSRKEEEGKSEDYAQTVLVPRPVKQPTPSDETIITHPHERQTQHQGLHSGSLDETLIRPELGSIEQSHKDDMDAPPDADETVIATRVHDVESGAGVGKKTRHLAVADAAPASATSISPEINSARAEPEVGLVLKNQFVLEEVLGRGGMGIVFKARDRLMEEMKDRNPFVAIKVLRPEFRNDQMLLMALQREFKKAQKLSHPQIAQMMDFTRDEATGLMFVIMQYLEGETLDRFIRLNYPKGMPFKKAFPLIQAMGQALAYAHRQGIVHLDFKPANVFVCKNGDIKVLDFGIAAGIGQSESDADQTVFKVSDLGALTPAYASLEMLDAKSAGKNHAPTVQDDVYAFSCVIFELLTGTHPFGKTSAVEAWKAGLLAKPPATLSMRQARSLMRGLAFKAEDRLASIEALVRKLTPLRMGSILIASAVTAIFLGFPAWQIQQDKQDDLICQSPHLQDVDIQKIKDLTMVASVHMEVGYLTSPPASNAALSYQEILKIDPCNKEAIDGMARINEIIQQQAWEQHDQGNNQDALNLLDDALVYFPNDQSILDLRKKFHQSN